MVFRKNDIPHNKREDIQDKEVVALYKKGLSSNDIGKKFSCSGTNILNILKRNNVKIRNTGYTKLVLQRKNEKKIIKQYLSGKSAYQIGVAVNLSEGTIRKILRENNIEIRDISEALSVRNYKHIEDTKRFLSNRMSDGGAIIAMKGNSSINTKPMRVFEKILENNKVEFEKEFVIENKSYDFFIKPNILIEIDGDYWHGNPSVYKKSELNNIQKRKKRIDKQKNSIADKNGYLLFRIWGSDLKRYYKLIDMKRKPRNKNGKRTNTNSFIDFEGNI